MKINISDMTEGRLTPSQVEALQKYFLNGGTWHQLLKLKPDEVEEVYAMGHRFYSEGDLDKALAAFSALIQLNPYVAKYWVAIGATLQRKEEYQDAISAYGIALTIEEHIPALYYSAQCAYALDQREECKAFLKKITASKENSDFLEKACEILYLMECEREAS
jgi:type III secretion system low calcium response chaperone LcrH/SycD